ncbi:hypothetical protein RUND412_006139 [Rhizina undulata]
MSSSFYPPYRRPAAEVPEEKPPVEPPHPKYLIFSDFDGTITFKDSNDFLTDNVGFGAERRKELNKEILEGKVTFRKAFKEMLDSVKLPFPKCIEYLRQSIKLDPGFIWFHRWCVAQNIPVVVVSSGLEQVIRALLLDLLGRPAEQVPIYSNKAKISEDKKAWEIEYRDDSDYGHDKSIAIKEVIEKYTKTGPRPTVFYFGDGVSDLSAAREADLLFAKEGYDLITYCEREGVPFTTFKDFKDIDRVVKEIVEGKVTTDELAAKGRKTATEETGDRTETVR